MKRDNAGACAVYAVLGADRFLRADAVEGLLAALSDETDALGPTRFDGAFVELCDVLDEVRTASLLGGRRVVLVDDADKLISKDRFASDEDRPASDEDHGASDKDRGAPDKRRAALEKYCLAPTETGTLILLFNSLPSNTKLYKAIAAKGKIIALPKPKGGAVVSWVVDRAKQSYGKRIAGAAARLLHDHVGDVLGDLDAELAKLATFVGERGEITAGDVVALTGRHRLENVFAVNDAIASHDLPRALDHWRQVLETDRAAPGRAMAGLAWSVRALIEAHGTWRSGGNLYASAGKMRTSHDVLRRWLKSVPVEQLEERRRDLLDADLAVKTGRSTAERAIERHIVKYTISGPGRRPSRREKD